MTDNKSLSYLMDIDKVNKEKFSQVISDIENLKTEVSNIKSKVDSSLPVDISSVNTSISDVKNDTTSILNSLSSDGNNIESYFSSMPQSRLGYIETFSSSNQIVNISGKGLFFGCASFYYSNHTHNEKVSIQVNIDGKISSYLGSDYYDTGVVTPELVLLDNKSSSDKWHILSSILNDTNFITVIPRPVIFNSYLRITVNNGPYYYMYVLL